MTLTLTIQNVDSLPNGESTQLRLDRHGAVIGRSPHSDWSLPDPKSYVSSTHCEIDYRDGAYLLVDKSTNGTFVNDGPARLTGPYTLRDGDVILIGHYRVGVQGAGGAGGADAAETGAAAGGKAQAAGWGGWGDAPATAPSPAAAPSSGWDAPAASPASGGWDAPAPSAPPPSPASGGWDAPAPAAAPSSGGWDAPSTTPADGGWAASPAPAAAGGWDASPAPTAPAPRASAWDAPSAPAAQGWDAPAAAPASAGWDAPAAPGASAWGAATPAQPGPGPGGFAASDPGSAWGAAGAGPAKPAASGWDALAPARDTSSAAAGGAPGGYEGPSSPMSGRGALAQNWSPPRVDAPSPPPPPAAAEPDVWGAMAASNTVDWGRGGFGGDWAAPASAPGAAPAPAPAAAAANAAWAAFLEAAGVEGAALKADPAQAAASAGGMMRRLVAGLVVMMEARARAKAQLGAQSTTLELKGNNPIKFARSPERVLAQLLNPPERGFMGANDAVEDSFRDLQAHQMATLAAMQGALRSTLDRFSPDAIRKRAETRGLLAKILPSAKNAALWDAYEREFEGVAKGSDEAFMDVFAKAFKAAYEQAAAQMKSQGR